MFLNSLETQINNNYKDVFGGFYFKIFEPYASKINGVILENNSVLKDKEIFLNSFTNSLLREAHTITFRTLLYEFYLYKDSRLNLPNENFYQSFARKLNDPVFQNSILEKYPYLKKILNKRISFKIEYLKEILNKFEHDYEILQNTFKISNKTINKIEFSHGDSHNKGKSVAIIKTNEKKIVFKPHSLLPDQLFYKILSLNKDDKLKFKPIKMYTHNDYGWMEYIHYKECNTENEVKNFYYKIGGLLANLYLFSTSDLHFENLMAHGDTPYILDFEAIISSSKSLDDNLNKNIFEQYLNSINNSVLGTMILPSNHIYSPFDFDLSALSSKKVKSEKILSSFIENSGTDEIKITKTVSPIEKIHNLVKINGHATKPLKYINFILKGFENAYTFILNNKETIKCTFDSSNLENIETRFIYRPTSLYGKFIEAVCHPKYLCNEKNVNRVFNKLIKNETSLEKERSLAEIQALKDFDIPYFTQPLSNKNLHCNKQKYIKGFFKNIPTTKFYNRLNQFNVSDMNTQLYYIKLSLYTDEPTSKFKNYFDDSFVGENINNILDNIGERLITTSIQNEKQCTWPLHMPDKDRIIITPLNLSLYHTSGILLFLLELYKYTKSEKYLTLAKKGIASLESISKLESTDKVSVFNGAGTYVYLYAKFYAVTKEKYFYEKMKNSTNYVMSLNDNSLDFLDGISGLICILVECFKKFNIDYFLDYSFELAKKLIIDVQSANNFLTGFSHGYSGVIYSLCKVYSITNDSYILNSIKTFTKLENKFFDESRENWEDLRDNTFDSYYWCHGLPGITLSRLELFKLGLISKSQLLSLVNSIMTSNHNISLDHSICHGILGNVDILIECNKFLNCNYIKRYIYTEINNFVESTQSKSYLSGHPSKIPIDNFMLGKYGIAYILLRYKHNDTSNVLLLNI